MKVLEILFACFAAFVGIALYTNGVLRQALNWLNHKYLTFCKASLDQTDDQLIKTIKPVVFGFSLFLLIAASMLLQWWGESDQDVKQLSFTWFGTTVFSGLVLIPTQEFSIRIKEIVNMLTSTAKWSSIAMAGVIIFIILVFSAFGKTISNEEIQEAFLLGASSIAGALAIFALIIFAAIIGIPFILQRLFVWALRKMIKFTLEKDRTNPINVPIFFVSLVLIVISVVSLLIDKLN